jgi:iron complex outermembrane recepter protein
VKNSKGRPLAGRIATGSLLGLIAGIGFAPGAIAQTTGEDNAVAEGEIVIVGTRTSERTVLTTPVPVDVLDRAALESAGAQGGEFGATLQTLAPSFNFQRQSNSGPADIVRAAQLRGMSPDQTLVLINGKRRHTTSVVNLESKVGRGATPVDFNSIATTSIDRVEVLRDGAGAQYGSDAIAGVINVILDSSDSGGEITFTYGANVTDFTYPVFSGPFSENGTRTDSITDGETSILTAKAGFSLADRGFLSIGGEYKKRESTRRGGADGGAFFIFPTPVGSGAANEAFLNRRQWNAGDPKVEDFNLWANAAYALDGGVELYGFFTYNDRDGEGSAFFRYPDSTQNVPALYPNGFRPVTIGENTDLGLSGGLRGQAGDWFYDVSLTYGANDYTFGLRNTLNASFGSASQRNFKVAEFGFDQLTLNVDATRPVDFGSFRGVLALGAEVRREEFESKPGDVQSYAAGPIITAPIGSQGAPGLAPADAASGDRTVFGAYAELGLEITPQFFVDGALRVEDYSDFGNAVLGKVAARYEFTEAFALRGSVSNSFRAPSLSQIDFQFSTSQFGPGGSLQTVRTLRNSGPIARALGAKPLKEETSENFTVGFVAQLGPDFVVTLDAFQINVDDRITLSEGFFSGPLTTFIQTNFGIPGVQGVNFFTNAVDTETTGFDLVVSYRTDLFDGALNLTGAFNRSENKIKKIAAIPSQLAVLGISGDLVGPDERNTLTTAAPTEKFTLTGQWENESASLLVRVIRYGETERVFSFFGPGVPSQVYGAETQLDLEGTYRFTPNFALSVGGSNVLDNYADRSSGDIYTAGVFPYDVISPIGFNGAYWYARAKLSF